MIGAVDIGGTKIAVGLVSPEGRILAQEVSPTAAERGVDEGLERICAMLAACQAQIPGSQLEGIGVGCTGPVDPETGVLGPNSFLPFWEGVALVERLRSLTGVSVAIENDADAAALGEAAWGAGRGATHCIYVTVSTGIGCGILVDGKLYRGVGGAHPELGHHVVDWSSKQECYCGGRGCWESLASGPAMAAWYQAQMADAGAVDAHEICYRAAAGELLALESVERESIYLGIGLANLINAFVPQVIVLGGGVMQSWPLFTHLAQETIRQCCRLVPYEKTQLRLASLGARTGLAGAARVWYHRFQPLHP
jgi:glucokinase